MEQFIRRGKRFQSSDECISFSRLYGMIHQVIRYKTTQASVHTVPMLTVKAVGHNCHNFDTYAMPDKSVSVTFTDDGVRFHTSEHDSEFKWSLITALWRFDTEWLIFTYWKDIYTLIPASGLDSELQAFILTKLKENNTKVT